MATINVTNPGNNQDIQPNAMTAIAAAVNGDIIQFPEGEFIVNSTISTTKKLSFYGAGVYKTTLYRSESVSDATLLTWKNLLLLTINDTTSSGIVIKGFTFKGLNPSLTDGTDGGSIAADTGIKIVNAVDFVIAQNRIQWFGQSGINISHDDSIVGGLIYNNIFYNNSKGTTALGLGYGIEFYGGNLSYILDPELGSSKFIYIENNVFQYQRHTVATGGCAKYVFRYNNVHDNVASTSYAAGLDMHEPRGQDKVQTNLVVEQQRYTTILLLILVT